MASILVKKVTVSTPITGVIDLNTFNFADVGNGDLLVYDSASSEWKADSDTYLKVSAFNASGTGLDSAAVRGLFSVSGDLSYDSASAQFSIDVESVYTSANFDSDLGAASLTSVGALNSGSITSGFGSIDIGSSTFTTTGTVNAGAITVGSAVLSEAELEILDGATVTTAELNILDGVTSTAAELNILDGVTATAAELNILDGVTSTAAELNILDGVTATTAELNILDGVTSTASELNLLDGVSGLVQADFTKLAAVDASASELNILDGVTASTAELNILDGVTSTTAELNLLDGVTATAGELSILDGDTSATSTTVADADRVVLNDGGTMKQVAVTDLNAYFSGGTVVKADDVQTGDAAVTITTSVGDITIDAAANDTDIIFKGTDGGVDTTFLTLDGSAGGAATFTSTITAAGTSVFTNLDISGNVDIDGSLETDALSINGTSVSATAAELNILDGVTSTTAELNILDGVTSTTAELNILDGVTATAAELNILDGVTASAAEINIIDGTTSASSATLADGDRIVTNHGGTMKQVAVTDFAAYFDDEITAMANLVTVGALNSGSITSGFGAIDNGTSGIRTNTFVAETAYNPDANDGATLGTTSLGFADAFLADGGTIQFGDDQDVTLTHIPDAGLRLNSTMALQFNDASQFINAPSATVLDITATDEVEINATLADINANLDVSGTYTGGGLMTTGGNIVIPDGGYIGAASDTDAIQIEADGDVVISQDLAVAGNLTVTGTTTQVNTVTMEAANAVVFEGATADAHETTLTVVDPTADRTINLPNVSGTLPVLAAVSTTAVTSTPEELNILDGVTSTTAELNLLDGVTSTTTELNILDGDTSATSTTVADADRVVFNDAGTMKQVAVTDLSAYFDDKITAMPNLVSTGALDTGSITSGFGTINTGASAITTTGLISGGSLDIDDVLINGTTIGHTDDTDLITLASGLVTVAGEISVTTLDIGGTNVTSTAAELNILDGVTSTTAELNILDGVTSTAAELNILDGVTSTAAELNILDGVTSTAAELNILDGATVTVAELNILDGDTSASSVTVADADRVVLNDNGTMKQVAMTALNAYMSAGSTVAADDIQAGNAAVNITTSAGNITIDAAADDTDIILKGTDGGVDTTFLTIDGSAAGKATFNDEVVAAALTIDNVVINGATIGHGNDTDLMTVADGILTVAGEVQMTTLDIGGTNVTATAAELNILDGVTSTAAELNILDGVTATAAELNILDGVTATATELNLIDGVTATTAELNILDGVTTTAAELNILDGDTSATSTTVVDADRVVFNDNGTMKQVAMSDINTYVSAGSTVAADDINAGDAAVTITTSAGDITIDAAANDTDIIFKGTDGGVDTTFLTLDGSAAGKAIFNNEIVATALDISGDVDIDGTLETDALSINGTAVTSTAAELNILDGVTSTAAELNILDGDTSATSTTVADADRVVLNDNGTMKQVAMTDINAYVNSGGTITGTTTFADDVKLQFGNTPGPELAIYSIGSSSMIDETGAGYLYIRANDLILGKYTGETYIRGYSDDRVDIYFDNSIKLSTTNTGISVTGDVVVSGTVDGRDVATDGTKLDGIEANATANQTDEEIQDIVGAMVTSNTETGIAVTYQDADGTLDFALDAAQTTITSLLATDIKIGEDDQTKIDFETADEIHFYAANAHQIKLIDGALVPLTDNDIDLGTSSLEFKNAFFDGTVTSDAFAGPLTGDVTGDVTGNVSGSAATVTGAAQSAITSLGTLTTLTVDDITINGSTISDAGDLTVDVAGDIILDADGDDIHFHAGAFHFASITKPASNGVEFSAIASDKDIFFKGNDGGSTITALTLDMSAAGAATFNAGVTATTLAAETGTFTNTTTDDTLLLTSTDSSSTAAPVLTFKRNSASVADADYLGQLKFKGENDADQEVIYAKITAKIDDASDGSEDGLLEFTNKKAGSNNIGARLTSTALKLINGTTLEANDGITVDNITIDGTEIDLSSGDLTLDVAGDIILDADGGDFVFKDGGTSIFQLQNSSSDFHITSMVNNKDIVFRGNDDGSFINALTLDMSDAGAATFNDKITAVGTSVFTNLDISGDVDVDGTLETDALSINGTAVTSTAAELNILDGVTATAAEINLIDGGTARGTTAVASGDGILINDAGTMRMTNVDTVSTYFSSHNVGGANIVTTGALNSGSITSGFGNINNGSSTITTTGAVSTGTLAASTGTFSGILKTDDTTEATSTTDGSLQTDGGLSVAKNVVAGNDVSLLSDGAVLGFGADKEVTLTHIHDAGLRLNSTFALQFNDASQYIYAPSGTVLDIHATDEIELNATLVDINANVEISGNLTVAGTTTQVDTVTMNAQNAVVFEGATADSNETTLTIIDPTADRTINLPNVSGTLPVLAAASTTQITSTPEELNLLDGSSANSVVNSKAVVYGSSGELAGTLSTAAQGNVTSLGTLTALTVDNMAMNGNTLTTTSADYVIDASHDIVLDADGGDIVFRDGGSGFFNISNSSLDAVLKVQQGNQDFIIKGVDGSTEITALTLDMSAAGAATFNDKITAVGTSVFTNLDISGDVDVDGTLEADAITLGGTALATSATTDTTNASNIASGTLAAARMAAAQTAITSILATDVKIGEDDQTKIDFETADEIHFYAANAHQIKLVDGALVPVTDNDIDLGTSSLEFKNAYFDGTVTADAFAGPLTGDVTGNVSGTAATVTGGAQSAITSLGTLSALTVDNVVINGATIGHGDDTDLMTVADGILTVAGEISVTTLDIGGTNVTSTAAELNILDGVTATAAELNALDGITAVVGELNALDIGSTAVGTAVASKAVILDANKDYTGIRNFTVSGELDAATGDFSGDVDIDGTLEADAITVNGTALAEVISDTVGAMVGSNTESGISVVYQDADNTLDFTVGTLNQNTTGSAATLTTARTIGGVSFDGSANIDLPGVNSAGNQNTSGSAATLTTARTIHGVSFDGSANIDLSEVISDTVGAMFSSNTESGITATYQDADNTIDLTVGTLNQNTTGSAATLTTARTINGTSFDGSANITLGTGSVTHAMLAADCIDGDNIGNDVINSEHYAAGSIDNEHIADNAINSEHYADGSIDTAHYADNSITEAKMANDAIGSAELKSLATLLILDSAGSTLRTFHCAGA